MGKRMSELVIGDHMRTFGPRGDIRHERFLMDFHGHSVITHSYLRVNHTGGLLEISPDHLLLIHASVQFMRAALLRSGDQLFAVSTAGKLVPQNITFIDEFVGRGAYAPLTFSGRLLVNGVAVSSYAFVWPEDILQEMDIHPTMHQMILHSHHIMHLVTVPLRWGLFPALWNINWLSLKCKEGSALHWFVSGGKNLFENMVLKFAFPILFK